MKLIHKTFAISAKANSESRSVRVVASSTAIDSYDDIVEQDWDLERYKKNPVVLYAHNQGAGLFSGPSAEETLPIGYASEVGVVHGKLHATLTFVSAAASPLADRVLAGFREGSIRAVSVGFYPRAVESEDVGGKEVYRLSQCELFEISVVPIGANPEAVALSRSVASANLKAVLGSRLPARKHASPGPKAKRASVFSVGAELARQAKERGDTDTPTLRDFIRSQQAPALPRQAPAKRSSSIIAARAVAAGRAAAARPITDKNNDPPSAA